MKNLSLFLFFLLNVFQLNAQSSSAYGAKKFAPENGKKLLIIGQDLGSVGGLDAYSDGYVDNIDCHVPAGVTSYTSIGTLNGLVGMDNWGAGDVRAQAYLQDETFDNSFIVIGLYMVNLLEAVSDGSLDENIRTLANWTKGQNRPVFIRIGYEFEGPWNSYTPNAFKSAWQHIVHVFDDENVKNAAYVWQSAGLNYSNILDWYPGDEYVNWVGYSQFDGDNMGQSIKAFAIEHDKPIMIAEATPRVVVSNGQGVNHWNNWYAPLFEEIYENDRIKAFAYINANWETQPMWIGQGWGDSRVQSDPYVKENWELETKKEAWLTGTEELFEALDYETWISTVAVEENATSTDELLCTTQENEIIVRLKNGGVMDKMSIYDFGGKLLYSAAFAQEEYRASFSFEQLQAIIIRVEVENKALLQRKIIR